MGSIPYVHNLPADTLEQDASFNGISVTLDESINVTFKKKAIIQVGFFFSCAIDSQRKGE